MARVIDPKPQKSVEKEAVCQYCGCLYAYVPNDKVQGYTCDYRGDKDYYYYVKCPNCDKPNIV